MRLAELRAPTPGGPSSGERPVRELWLCRPDRRNAMTPAMLDDLHAAIDEAEGPGPAPGALLIAGEGEAFCAGFDLAVCRESDGALRALLSGLSRAVRRLRRLPMAVVVAAHGAAVAGGCALLSGADVVVTNANAKLGYPVVRLGISPAVTAPGLRLCVGDGPSRARTLDPELISGAEAARIGLAHGCVPHADDVLPRARELAAALARKGSLALAQTRALLSRIEGTDLDGAFDAALSCSLGLVGGAEQRARMAALKL